MTLEEQRQNDVKLADWVISRVLDPQDVFDQNVTVLWTESGRERVRQIIIGAFTSARRNTATQPAVEKHMSTA